jgi:Transcriptional Coactivator p15 (PC4)
MPGPREIEWEVQDTLLELPLDDRNTIVVDLVLGDNGRYAINVREWFTRNGEDWFPGKRGMQLRPSAWNQIATAIFDYGVQNGYQDDDGTTAPAAAPPTTGGRKLGTPAKPATTRGKPGGTPHAELTKAPARKRTATKK